jgi:hypothetical protein
MVNSARIFDPDLASHPPPILLSGPHFINSMFLFSGTDPFKNGLDHSAKKISEQAPKERQAVKVDPKIFDRCAGEFQLAPGVVFTIRREGNHLMARLSGQAFLEIVPESEMEFFYQAVDAQMTFVKGDQGRVTELILHKNGLDRKAARIK